LEQFLLCIIAFLKTKAIAFGRKIVQFHRLFVQKLKKIDAKMLSNDVGTSSAGLICHASPQNFDRFCGFFYRKLDIFFSIVKSRPKTATFF
jgi:hypothetical protein